MTVEFTFNEEGLDAVKQRKAYLFKGASSTSLGMSMQTIVDIHERYSLRSALKTVSSIDNGEAQFDSGAIFEIQRVERIDVFNSIQEFVRKAAGYHNYHMDTNLFYTYAPGVGPSHIDTASVFIFGLCGETTYRLYDEDGYKDYTVEDTDCLYIPKPILHRAMHKGARIALSVGVYDA